MRNDQGKKDTHGDIIEKVCDNKRGYTKGKNRVIIGEQERKF